MSGNKISGCHIFSLKKVLNVKWKKKIDTILGASHIYWHHIGACDILSSCVEKKNTVWKWITFSHSVFHTSVQTNLSQKKKFAFLRHRHENPCKWKLQQLLYTCISLTWNLLNYLFDCILWHMLMFSLWHMKNVWFICDRNNRIRSKPLTFGKLLVNFPIYDIHV